MVFFFEKIVAATVERNKVCSVPLPTPRNIDQRETTKPDLLSMAERFRFQRHQRSCPFDWFNHCAFHENTHRKQWLYIQEPKHV